MIARLSIALVCLVAAASAAGPAAADVRLTYQGDQPTNPYAQWAAAMKIPQPDAQVTVRLDRDTWPPRATTVWIPDGVLTTITLGQHGPLQRWQFWHELGHVFDHTMMTDPLRAQFQQVIGKPGAAWWDGTETPPDEQFAEAYRACAQSYVLPRPAMSFEYGYAPTRARHTQACNIIRVATFLYYRDRAR